MKEGLNKETLRRLYIKEKRPLRDIAEMLGCSYTIVRHRCIKYRIRLRPKNRKRINLKKSVLMRLYVKEKKTAKKVAEMFSCSSTTVIKRCKEYGIPIRDKKIKGLTKTLLRKLYVKEGKTTREIARSVGCSAYLIETRCKQFGIPLRNPGSKKIEIDESTLRRLYVEERKTLTGIAKIFDCSFTTILKRVKRLGLSRS